MLKFQWYEYCTDTGTDSVLMGPRIGTVFIPLGTDSVLIRPLSKTSSVQILYIFLDLPYVGLQTLKQRALKPSKYTARRKKAKMLKRKRPIALVETVTKSVMVNACATGVEQVLNHQLLTMHLRKGNADSISKVSDAVGHLSDNGKMSALKADKMRTQPFVHESCTFRYQNRALPECSGSNASPTFAESPRAFPNNPDITQRKPAGFYKGQAPMSVKAGFF